MAVVALHALGVTLASPPAVTEEPNPRAGKKTDWATIDELLAKGDYAAAVTATTNEITKDDKPKPWDADFLPRSVEWARLWMRRGVAELKLGQLDAAEASFKEAYRLLSDNDFGRQVEKEARSGNVRTVSTLAQIDVDLLEVTYLRMAVLLERMRYANLGIDRASTEPAGSLSEAAARWGDELTSLERVATKARKDLAERLEKADPALMTSPYYQSLLGRFRAALAAGMQALERDKLAAATESSPGFSATAKDNADAVAARTLVAEAATALEAAIEAAAPQGVDSMKRDARIEASLMQADLLESEGRVLARFGEHSAARDRFTKDLALRQDVSMVRRVKQADTHADLFVPLLLSAETLLDEAQLALDANDVAECRTRILEASKTLARADGLAFPAEHPLRTWQKSLARRITSALATVKAVIPQNDAADAAARRIRRAVDGTFVTGSSTAP